MVLWEALRTPRETVEIATWLKQINILLGLVFLLWNLPGVFLPCDRGDLHPTWSPVDLRNLAVHLRHQPVLQYRLYIALQFSLRSQCYPHPVEKQADQGGESSNEGGVSLLPLSVVLKVLSPGSH